MGSFWASVTAPQATIISGLCTLAAALFGVLFGWWLFNGRVKDLKSAIEESEKLLNAHKDEVAAKLGEVSSQFSVFSDGVAAQMEALGQLRSSVSDIQDAAGDEPKGAIANAKDRIRELWYEVRDRLEALAADPEIGGRTRAAFARIDRRSYADLVRALGDKNLLGGNVALYLEAATLWARYKNGRSRPTAGDLRRMEELRNALIVPLPA